jgi:hypothetical protein
LRAQKRNSILARTEKSEKAGDRESCGKSVPIISLRPLEQVMPGRAE